MSELLLTLLFAFSLIALGLLGMSIGYLFKKKCLKKQCDVNPDLCKCRREQMKREQQEDDDV